MASSLKGAELLDRRNKIILARIVIISIVVLCVHWYQQSAPIEVASNPVEIE